MPTRIEVIEQHLAERFGRRHCLITGRAATAIYLALIAADLAPGEVLMPSTLCQSPAIITLLAGHTPVFVDVDQYELNLRVDAVTTALTPKTRAIIAVHLFGQPCQIMQLERLAREKELLLIEDAAQAPGATYDERAVGSFGDASVLSFGATKVLDAVEGGALLTDDATLIQRARELERQLPGSIDTARYTSFSTFIKGLEPSEHGHAEAIAREARAYRDLFCHRYDPKNVEALERELVHLDENLADRRKAAQEFMYGLSDVPIAWQHSTPSRVYHRLVGLCESHEQRERIITAMRERKHWIGTLYPPLHRLFHGGRERLAVAEAVGERVINLIVDRATLEREPPQESIHLIRGAI